MRVGYGHAGDNVSGFDPMECRANVKRTDETATAYLVIRIRVPGNTTDAELVALVDNETARLPGLIREAVAGCRRQYEPPASPWTG